MKPEHDRVYWRDVDVVENVDLEDSIEYDKDILVPSRSDVAEP